MKRLFISSFIVVIISVLLISFLVNPLLNKFYLAAMATSIEQYNQNLSRGVFFLVQQELQKVPQENWKSHIAKMQSHFGYPLSFRDYREVTFSKDQLNRLLAGKIVIIDYGKIFWQRIGNSNRMVGMGPLGDLEPTVAMNMAASIATMAFVGLVLLVWVFFFWRRLRTVSVSAVEFGSGNFDVRVKISPRSALAPLAGAFNSMADRIQTLIRSHKELTNAVSHELRTPIARIRFGLEMIRLSSDEKGKNSYTEGIYKDVDELDDLVSELLIYARFDRETLQTQKKDHEIVSWLENFAASMSSLPVKVQRVFLVENREMKARFDVKQMGRAIGNLLQNAARYGNGKVRLTLERDGDLVLIHVDDDGPGIPERDRERVFEPFTRLDASRSRESGGFGLGLAIVRQVAHGHGGTVIISDSDLGGSRFSIKWKALQ